MAIINVSGGGSALQDAINSASNGDTLLVDDGVYSPINWYLKSFDPPIIIRSKNGRGNCIIDGGHTYDESTDTHTGKRCVNGNNKYVVELYGFTLRNGYSANHGSGCFYVKGADLIIENCVALQYGGGAYSSSLQNSIIRNCSASRGGGAYNSTLTDCKIYNNIVNDTDSTYSIGGGTYGGTATNCEIFDNEQISTNYNSGGGGTYNTNTTNCYIHDNDSSISDYDSVYGGTHKNDLIIGGGNGNYYSCTIISDKGFCANLSSFSIRNCILYFRGENGTPMQGHSANRTNYDNCLFYPAVSNLVDKPSILNGVDPLLDDTYHLRKNSPCIGAGNAEYLQSATDLDGKAWKVPPSIGCYEFYGSKKYLPSALRPLGV